MVVGTMSVPMLRAFGTFDGPEILIIAAASILVVSLTFLSDLHFGLMSDIAPLPRWANNRHYLENWDER
jgi:hypothetical protein